MLIEVMCDEFTDHGKPRGRIPFHVGLNTILGSNSGSNSIGKVSVKSPGVLRKDTECEKIQ